MMVISAQSVVVWSAALVLIQIGGCYASATLKIQLKKYSSGGKDSNGDNCDHWITTQPQCDPEFVLCVDKYNGDNSLSNCYYHGQYKTGFYQERNTVTFENNKKLAGNSVDNPIVNNINVYQGLKFKVEAWDDDSGHSGDDLIDRLFYNNNNRPANSAAQARWIDVKQYGTRTSGSKSLLEFAYLLYCNENYYGTTCSQYCVASHDDVNGHYTCDSDTGNIICRPGWESIPDQCTVKIDDCEFHQCQNGATCLDMFKSYTCDCPPGYTGERCDVNIDECAILPNCLHGGTCEDEIDGFTCLCTERYVGDRCEHHVCNVTDYCLNGGTCYDDENGTESGQTVGCICPVQFTGRHCDVDKCEVLVCKNGGSCLDGVCHCPSNYIGALCDVDLCEHITCANQGSCVAGHCLCATGFTGRYCHENINDCIPQPCQHEGTCEDMINDYICRCLPGYNGTHCENILPVPWNEHSQHASGISSEQGSSPPVWIAGIVITLLAIIVIIIVVLISFIRRKRRLKQEQYMSSTAMQNSVENPVYQEREPTPMETSSPAQEKTGFPGPEFRIMVGAPPPYSLHADPANEHVYARPSDIQVVMVTEEEQGAVGGLPVDTSYPTKESESETAHQEDTVQDTIDNNDANVNHYDTPKTLAEQDWTPVKQPRISHADSTNVNNSAIYDTVGFINHSYSTSNEGQVSLQNGGTIDFLKRDLDENPYSTVGEVDHSVHNNDTNEKLESDI